MKNIFNNRRFKYGGFATLIAVGFIAAVIIINVISSVLVDRFPLSVDLTQDKVFELSDDTKGFLNTLSTDVEIIVLTDKQEYLNAGEYFAQAITVLDNYAKFSNKVKVSYVNVVNDPSLAAKYPDLQLSSNDILIRSDKRTKKIAVSDLFNISSDQYGGQTIASSRAEQALTSALVGVTADETVLVDFISGHDEVTGSGLDGILSSNNYDTVTTKLLSEDIKPEAKFVVINAPKRDFTPEEIKKLDTYLDNGGKLGKNLLYFADAQQPALPNLEAFLVEWGIQVGAGTVYETDTNKLASSTNPFYAFTEYGGDEYIGTLKDRSLDILMPYGRPITPVFEGKGTITTTKLLNYSAGSRLYPADAPEGYTPSENDQKGPFGAVVQAKKLDYVGTDAIISKVIVFSSSLGVDQSITSSPVVGNGDYVASIFNDISEKKTSIVVLPKTVGAAQLQINGAQIITLGVVFVILLPLAVLVFGIVIWFKRRNR